MSVAPFPFDDDHATSAFVGQTESTSRTSNIKPNKRSGSQRKPYPSSMSEKTLASVAPQMAHHQKESSGKPKHSTDREDKCKNKDVKGLEQTRRVRCRTIIRMVRGKKGKGPTSNRSNGWIMRYRFLPCRGVNQLSIPL
nr:hypothetical protein [Tanacetum cinerariifolium]